MMHTHSYLQGSLLHIKIVFSRTHVWTSNNETTEESYKNQYMLNHKYKQKPILKGHWLSKEIRQKEDENHVTKPV